VTKSSPENQPDVIKVLPMELQVGARIKDETATGR